MSRIRSAGDSVVGAAVSILPVVLVLASVAWAADLYRLFGLILFLEQFVAGILGCALLLVFLIYPRRRGEQQARPPWYDSLAGLAGFLAAGYIAFRFPALGEQMFYRPLDGIVAGAVVLVLTLEGLRRTVGWVIFFVVIGFVAYGLVGNFLPAPLTGRPLAPDLLAYYLAYDANGILGTPIIVISTVVIAFILFGSVLTVTGGSSFFTDISQAVMGRYRGASAKIAVTASGLFGSISGSAVSNVASTGVITIPMMRKAGYTPTQAAAIEAVASTGGQLMPPVMGSVAFLIAEFLQVNYSDVVLAALLPALLYYVALFIATDLEAARRGDVGLKADQIPSTLAVLRHGWHFILSFAVLIYALFARNERPETAALLATVTVLVTALAFGHKGQRPSLSDMIAAMRMTGLAALDIIMICTAAGMVIGVLAVSGLGFSLTLLLVQIASESLAVLLVLSALVCIVLGMGMPTVGVYVLLAALVAPAMVEVGVEPMSAHLFVLYFGMMSMITPPVAMAAFAAASIAKADPMRVGFVSVRFGWIAYVIPFLFVLSPTLILIGEAEAVAFAVVTALGGVWLASIAMAGYGAAELNRFERALFGLAGLMMLTPAGLFEGAIYLDIVGIGVGVLLVAREFYFKRSRSAAAEPPPTLERSARD